MISLPTGRQSCRLKVKQIQPIKQNQFFIVKTKATSQSQRIFGVSYNWCCTSSTALICHQARAVTTELLLHHCLFRHQNQQAGVATLTGICTQTLQQAILGTCHQSWPTAHDVEPLPLIVSTTYTGDDLRRGICLIQQT